MSDRKLRVKKDLPLCVNTNARAKCEDRYIHYNNGLPKNHDERVKMICMANPKKCPFDPKGRN